MKNENLITVLSAVLKCGYLDVKYLLNLLDNYNIDIYDIIESIEVNY